MKEEKKMCLFAYDMIIYTQQLKKDKTLPHETSDCLTAEHKQVRGISEIFG